MKQRNTYISIAKALGIIAVVVGHSECPGWLCSFIFEWHMPLFFIVSGYFFSLKYLDDEATFVKKRIKGLYVPFVKWSVVFLLLHNLFFKIGLMNEHFGNAAGGVLHPYNWHQIQQNFWDIFTFMASYDEFICGAYWFFRALLVASIAYLILFKLIKYLMNKVGSWLHVEEVNIIVIAVVVMLVPFLLAMWKCGANLKISSLVQGGYRDVMGTFFFGLGFLFRRCEGLYRKYFTCNYFVWFLSTLLWGAVTWAFSHYASSGMSCSAKLMGCLRLPVPALCGWLMIYNVSAALDHIEGPIKRFLCYCGDHTLYIMLFHVISFKVVNVVKILYYNLDWQQMGCHMVIHEHSKNDYFWLLYTFVGVLLPLAFYQLPRSIYSCVFRKKSECDNKTANQCD